MGELYVPLPASYADDERVLELVDDAEGLAAFGLLCLAMARAKTLATDGVLSRRHLERLFPDCCELVKRLCDVGLLTEIDDGRFQIVGWLGLNMPAASINAMRDARARDGQRGNHKRWGHPADFEHCPICHPSPPTRPPESQASRPAESSPIAKSESSRREGSEPDRHPTSLVTNAPDEVSTILDELEHTHGKQPVTEAVEHLLDIGVRYEWPSILRDAITKRIAEHRAQQQSDATQARLDEERSFQPDADFDVRAWREETRNQTQAATRAS